jgi:hypothetical protein
MTRTIFIATTLALAVTLPAVQAQAAGAPRTFISAAGSDSNSCTNVATPCRHLAAAYATTAANGEIYVLDPANYGSLTIIGPVSIEGHGWASIAPPSGGNPITINANPGDKINIVGVVLDGTAVANTSGIAFNSGGSLTVQDSVIRNFSGDGINFKPNSSALSQLFVSNTLLSDNSVSGIVINPAGSGTTNGVIDHVRTENNGDFGINAISATQIINVTISDSVSANNGLSGVNANSTTQENVMVRNSTIANNAANGCQAVNAGASIRLTRSTITGNKLAGWIVVSSGTVTSYNDNNMDDNGTNNTPPPIPYK